MPEPYVILQGANTIVFCVECDKEYSLPVSTEQVLRWQQGELIQKCHAGVAEGGQGAIPFRNLRRLLEEDVWPPCA